jgi:hypothetical protein
VVALDGSWSDFRAIFVGVPADVSSESGPLLVVRVETMTRLAHTQALLVLLGPRLQGAKIDRARAKLAKKRLLS